MKQERTNFKNGLLITLCLILALEFILGGGMKFMNGAPVFGPPYAERFLNWGYPAWFRFVIGTGELLAAFFLLSPRTRFLGSAMLLIILAGAVITHIIHKNPLGESISAPIHLVLTGIIAWVSRPSKRNRPSGEKYPKPRINTNTDQINNYFH